jgi:hypothetical protein
VYLRVGELDGKIYLDLGGKNWDAVEIDADGWRVIPNPPLRFRRSSGTLPLSSPERGGSVETLRSYINVVSDNDFILFVAWLLATLRPRGPYPILSVAGEHGAAKTSACKIARSIVDPHIVAVRAPPREDRDLFVAAYNSHVLAFDNISGLPPWLADSLCRLATGGGYAVRENYSDRDEVLLDAIKPMVINGINDLVSRPDLTDRSILLGLAAISDTERKAEAVLWAAFDKDRPKILGALLDAVSHGLRELPTTHLEKLPRMADFATWVTACEGALWKAGTFLQAYTANIIETIGKVIENDIVASAVMRFSATTRAWEGSSTMLLERLGDMVTDSVRHSREWPGNHRALSSKLRRIATPLRHQGVDIKFGGPPGRLIYVTVVRAWLDDAETAVATSGGSNATRF